jgi:hypothetical protein
MLLICICIAAYKYEKIDYCERIINIRSNASHCEPYLKKFEKNSECPVLPISTSEFEKTDITYWQYFSDPFGRNHDTARYYPIYNRQTLKRLSFIILSCGIDGKFDNILSINDSLFEDNYLKKLKLYNPDENNQFGFVSCSFKFNIDEYKHGDKDYLLFYCNCEKYLKHQKKKLEDKNIKIK